MGKLTGQTIASSYDQLLIVDDADGVNASLQSIESADTGGSSSALKIATNKVEVIPGSDDANAFEVSQADGTAILTVDSSTPAVNLASGFKLAGSAVTSTAAELNYNAGVTAGTVEASKAVVADSDKYVLGEQGRADHVANTMPAHYYRFDGDEITVTDDPDLDFGTGNFSIAFRVYMLGYQSYGSVYNTIIAKGAIVNLNDWYFYYNSTNVIWFGANSDNVATADGAILDKWINLVGVHDSGVLKLYINGVLQSNTGILTGSVDNSHDLVFSETSSRASNIELSDIKLFNHALSASEVKQLSSGASVPYKYKGASQTDLMVGDGALATPSVDVTAINSNYTALQVMAGSTTGSVASNVFNYSLQTNNSRSVRLANALEIGKQYTIRSLNITAVTGSWKLSGSNTYADDGYETITTTSNGDHTFIAVTANLYLVAATSTHAIQIDASGTAFTLVQIGAVAEYDASGMSEEHWFDTSGNDLHGDVTGASLENQGDGGATKSITLTPRTLPTTANASEGQIVYDSGASALKVFNGTAWETITSS